MFDAPDRDLAKNHLPRLRRVIHVILTTVCRRDAHILLGVFSSSLDHYPKKNVLNVTIYFTNINKIYIDSESRKGPIE